MRLHRAVRLLGALAGCALAGVYGTREVQAADPPKTIIDIGTSPLCTTLRESVLPVLVGLHTNDALITTGGQQLGQWAHDQWLEGSRGGFWRMDRLRVEIVVSSLVRNFSVIDGILNDPKRFPRDKPNSAATSALHDRLQAIEDRQRDTLNSLYGPVDGSMTSDMMQINDRTVPTKAFAAVPAEINSVGRSVGHFVTVDGNDTMEDPAMSRRSSAGLPAPATPPTPQPGSLQAQQSQIAATESAATEVIVRAADRCKKVVEPQPKS